MKRWILGAVVLCACSSTPEPETSDPVANEPGPATQPKPNAPAVNAEIGALDPDAAAVVVDEIRGDVGACFDEANDSMDLPVVGGDIDVVVRVSSDGSVRYVYPAKSDIGHAGVEACILALHEAKTWPKPEGGEEGIARTHYGRDPAGRRPVDWTAADLGSEGGQLAAKLGSCASQAATAGLSVTVYVDPDGRAMAAGAAAEDEKGIDALDCAVKAAKSLTYPSPGSYPAKVTVQSR